MKMETLAVYARPVQVLLNRALDMEADMQRVAKAIDFTTEDWRYMYKNHRRLAHELSAILDKYGEEVK